MTKEEIKEYFRGDELDYQKDLTNLVLANQDIDISWINLEMIWDGMLNKQIEEQLGLPFPKSLCEMKKGRTINLYVEAKSLKKFIEISAKRIIEEKGLLDKFKEKTIEITEKIRNYGFELFENIDNLSNSEILDILPKIKKLQSESMVYGCGVAFTDAFGDITNIVTSILKKRNKLKYPTHIYSAVLLSPEKTLTQKAYEDIVNSKLSNKNLLKKYFWLNQGYVGRGLTEYELKEIKKHKINKEEGFSSEELFNELKLNKKEQNYFRILKDLMFVKSLRADSRQFLNVIVSMIMDKIARDLNQDVRLLETLYTEELCELLLGNNKIFNSLESRFEHSVFIAYGPSKYKIITGNFANEFLNDRLQKIDKNMNKEIKGQIASPGKIIGNVKIIFGPQHINKINEGDILVSIATSPQILPAMIKATAFITDIGGITSHAAIVAREMKKPCIIGTKIATKVLKDGDLVEVDAEKGVIKILK